MSKKGTKRPKTTCPSCGTQLSQAALKRHRGKRPCVERYNKQRLIRLHGLKPGESLVDWSTEDLALRVAQEAGVPPEDSPVRQEILWLEDRDKPQLHYVAPTWLVLSLRAIQDHVSELNVIKHQRKYGRSRGRQVDESAVPRLEAVINTTIMDAATILRLLDHEAQLGLTAALAIVKPAVSTSGGRSTQAGQWDWAPVREMLRRFASEALGGA